MKYIYIINKTYHRNEQNKEQDIEMTVAELAKESETSDASISRFCKKCHLKGFHHLKISLAKVKMLYFMKWKIWRKPLGAM